jgi:hypothetical protein
MISFDDFKTEDEYLDFLESLDQKVHRKQTLSLDEQEFLCKCVSYEYQKTLSFCDNLRFKRLFLKHFDSNQKGYSLENYEKVDLNIFLCHWEELMKKENHTENLLNVLAIETRSELKKILPNFSLFDKIFRRKEYRARQHEIIGYSKFAYIKIKSIFSGIGDNKVETKLNGNKIEIDEYSLAHIYMRHYAEQVRPYETDDKSYFTPEIEIENVPFVIKEIIDAIETSGVYGKDGFNNINVRYKNRDYKIYCKKVTKQAKGVGNIEVNRVNTFYPIELKQDTDQLLNYILNKINSQLAGYLKKTP